MKDIIINNGFKKGEFPNTFVKGDWTIRFDNELIEIFNDPDKSSGKYIIYPISKIDIEDLLKEINEL